MSEVIYRQGVLYTEIEYGTESDIVVPHLENSEDNNGQEQTCRSYEL